VLLKGGHGCDQVVTDILVAADGLVEAFHHPRISTPNSHGTGCTLSAAITANIAVAKHAQGSAEVDSRMLRTATSDALGYLARALAAAANWSISLDPVGAHGPVNHQVDIAPANNTGEPRP